MGELKHTISDLRQMQSLSLESKIRMTETRIRGWIKEFGEDGVYISFSGGKDSTVLMDIIRNDMGLKNIPAFFVDVPTQYPELKEFAKTWDDVEIIKPQISFMEVCEKYGFPLISKEVSQVVYEAKVSLKEIEMGKVKKYKYGKPISILQLEGKVPHREKGEMTKEYSAQYDKSRYSYFLDAPFTISNRCCNVMKKHPIREMARKTGRKAITAQMADESKLRTQKWLQNGCNAFNVKEPISNPLSFWTEQDILRYIYENKLPICSVYGDVVEDWETEGIMENQVTFDDFKDDKVFKTTGCKRTGCMLCGFGCHMKGDDRFLQLKQTHPKMYKLLDVVKNNGVTFREAIEWANEHGGLNIRL